MVEQKEIAKKKRKQNQPSGAEKDKLKKEEIMKQHALMKTFNDALIPDLIDEEIFR